ncbi:D-alanyl-D-alanine carboxypeptidase family protein [Bartonella vinsonii]|uniref:serine-type D-Ala-D-Ala carboxypeptidase n=1 Tax=Bartonella vinsonii subsp. berkhoffii str. Tweed TaxID=1094502 RepID=N6UQP6_BARVB|nr:D-alanyl-D-alanine carboxypeptidase family protein [Bartonella vinsonii]AGF75861.1 penicillin-binding protein [Bartonella vinsonii subsp. berkhoffii str. Winnie]ENN94669.1 penicillin-binding protein [Bartonella vinsonii subsp. berkhoffii str. Tweed]
MCVALRVLFTLLCMLMLEEQGRAQNFQISASQILLLDDNTDTILYEKKSDSAFFPASLAKLMTAEVVFHQLKEGLLSRTQKFQVSENAWRKGGAPSGTTTMFAKVKTEMNVSDLLRGLIIVNGNDAAIILAEGIAGSEANFAKRMNQRAKALGLLHSHFVNATGLPEEGQFVTLRDMIILARHIVHEYPDYYVLYREPDFTWNKIFQRNKNPLLSKKIGVEGFCSGYSEEEGFSIVTTVYKNHRRLFLAINGLQKKKDYTKEVEHILQWGMTAFDLKTIFTKGEAIGHASVYGGVQNSVPLIVKEPISFMLSNEKKMNIKAKIKYHGPLKAPIVSGQPIGILQILEDKKVFLEKPVFAGNNIQEGSFFTKVKDAFYEITIGWLRKYL